MLFSTSPGIKTSQTSENMNKDRYYSNNTAKNWYVFSKTFKTFALNNPDLIKPVHYALYFWIIELNNELRWPDKVLLHTKHTMLGIGIKDRERYYITLKDLENWGFIKIISTSPNQYTSNQISLLPPEKDFIPLEPTFPY